MKGKIFTGFLAVMLLLAMLVSCSGDEVSQVRRGEEVISLLVEMVQCEDYKSLYALPAAYDETVNRLREGDYSKSAAVYELSISEEDLLEVLGVDKEAFSAELYRQICESAYLSIATRINEKGGPEAISVSVAFAAGKTFVSREVDADTMYLYVFENGCPILVTFIRGEDDSVSASARFILDDSFVTDDEGSIAASFEAAGIGGVTAKRK